MSPAVVVLYPLLWPLALRCHGRTIQIGFVPAFCWMTNHVHLATQVATIPLSTIMHNFALQYMRWMHRHQQRNGYLFQGRYKALFVSADGPYVLALVRYIHLNPVRPDYHSSQVSVYSFEPSSSRATKPHSPAVVIDSTTAVCCVVATCSSTKRSVAAFDPFRLVRSV